MKAIVVSKVGGAEDLRLSEVADPIARARRSPGRGEAAGVNFVDIYHRSGLYEMKLPFVPGLEGAGTVAGGGIGRGGTSGRGQGRVDRRQRVVCRNGIVSTRRAGGAHPGGIDSKTAAAVLLQGLTAHFLATDTFPSPSETDA